MRDVHAFVGTYTHGGISEGIYQIHFSGETEKLTIPEATRFREHPSFLVYDSPSRRLFSVKEVSAGRGPAGRGSGDGGGRVAMLVADEETRTKTGGFALETCDECGSLGDDPCHLFYDSRRKRVVVANYGSGGVAVIAVEDRRLEAIQGIQHKGSSVDKSRQEGPHAHSATPDPTGDFVLVCDLGLDEILVYRWKEDNTLDEKPVCRAKVPPGSGPRHFAFHPNGRYGYVANEMGNTVTMFEYDSRGTLEAKQTFATLPESYSGVSSTADIHTTKDGGKLYISNRGHDSVTVFVIDENTGSLTLDSHIASGGATPRNFALSPDGAFIFTANQDSDSIVVTRLSTSTQVASISIPKPVCIEIT